MTGQGGVAGLVTREHALVRRIDERLGQDDHKDLLAHPRVKSLADMLRRHGLLQVVAFLRAKGQGDGAPEEGSKVEDRAAKNGDPLLLELLAEALKDELKQASRLPNGEPLTLDARSLAGLGERSAVDYLYLNELAIQAAIWIQRLTAARVVLDEQRRQQQEGA